MHVTCFPFCYIKQAKDLKNDYYKAYLINAKLGSWPMFMDNSDTIKKMYTKAFWDIEDIINPKPKPDPGNGDSGSSSTTYIIIGVVCGVVVIAGIIVAIIIIRKRGSKGESLM